MHRFSLLQAIPLSFFSRDLYRDVAGAWRGAGILYLVVLVALLALVTVLRMQASLQGWVKGPAQEFVEQVPGIHIRHRVVEVDRPMPYVIKDRKGDKEMIIVDTTGTIGSLDSMEAGVLLTADRLLYRKSAAETRVFSLASVENLRIDSTRARRWLGLVAVWAIPCITPFVFGGIFVFRMVQLMAFALVGMLVAGLARVRLDFQAIMRLTAVALTPALIIDLLVDLAKPRMAGWGFLWTLITLGYVVWAVLVNRPAPGETSPAASSPPPPVPS